MARYNYTQAFNKLIQFATLFGYKVYVNSDNNYVLLDDQEIHLSPNPIEIKVYYLLHELGHIIVDINKFHDDDIEYDIEVIAWLRGIDIANQLGIQINVDKFNKLKQICLDSYKN
jgi:hypothetical protein